MRRALFLGDWKLIQSSDGKRELYDLARDPEEEKNLVDVAPEKESEMFRLVIELFTLENSSGEDGLPQELDEDTRARLKALGYI